MADKSLTDFLGEWGQQVKTLIENSLPITTPSVILSIQSFTMQRGKGPVTVAVTTMPSVTGGNLSRSLSAPDFCSMNNDIIIIAPDSTVEPGTYFVTLSVTETAPGYRTGVAQAMTVVHVIKEQPTIPTPTFVGEPYNVTVEMGESFLLILAVMPSQMNSVLSFTKVSGPDWCSVSGSNLYISPPVGTPIDDDFLVVIKVVETVGAGTEDEINGSATTTVYVTVSVSDETK